MIFGKANPEEYVGESDLVGADKLQIETAGDQYLQMENRKSGFLYLKNLCNTLIKTDLVFNKSSKCPGMTPGEVEFLEDIQNLQNYKPIMVPQETKESTKEQLSRKNTITKKPDLSKWKPRKMSYKDPEFENQRDSPVKVPELTLIKFDPLKSFEFVLKPEVKRPKRRVKSKLSRKQAKSKKKVTFGEVHISNKKLSSDSSDVLSSDATSFTGESSEDTPYLLTITETYEDENLENYFKGSRWNAEEVAKTTCRRRTLTESQGRKNSVIEESPKKLRRVQASQLSTTSNSSIRNLSKVPSAKLSDMDIGHLESIVKGLAAIEQRMSPAKSTSSKSRKRTKRHAKAPKALNRSHC